MQIAKSRPCHLPARRSDPLIPQPLLFTAARRLSRKYGRGTWAESAIGKIGKCVGVVWKCHLLSAQQVMANGDGLSAVIRFWGFFYGVFAKWWIWGIGSILCGILCLLWGGILNWHVSFMYEAWMNIQIKFLIYLHEARKIKIIYFGYILMLFTYLKERIKKKVFTMWFFL